MNFEQCLLEQIQCHPSMGPGDVVKQCYQAAFGAEHLLEDMEGAKNYLKEEYDGVTAKEIPLYEPISERVCRVNLAAWKYHGFPIQWLFPLLARSPFEGEEKESTFYQYLESVEKNLGTMITSFSMAEWKEYLTEYRKKGLRPVHHSQQYREKEHPAYRIVDQKYIPLFPILKLIATGIPKDGACVVVIDGRAASGKTTLANNLSKILQAQVVRMDDFFLPPKLRTPKRFAEPGGNVHYERFAKEVLPYLASKEGFSYEIFDCSLMDYSGKRKITAGEIRIVEGSYSLHPIFGDYGTVTIFSDVSEKEQMRRIYERNGEQMAHMFQERWIPLEEQYFKEYAIDQKADLVVRW